MWDTCRDRHNPRTGAAEVAERKAAKGSNTINSTPAKRGVLSAGRPILARHYGEFLRRSIGPDHTCADVLRSERDAGSLADARITGERFPSLRIE